MLDRVKGEGDEARFRRPAIGLSFCYREYNVALQDYLRRNTRSSHDAEDLAQEVYLRLARMRCLGGIDDPQAFLFRAAKNLLRDRFRRTRTRGKHESPYADTLKVVDFSGEPSLVFESIETLTQVERVLDSLKETTRRAFLWHRVEQRAHVEIAAEMGVSVSMVEKHVKAATAALRAAGISVDRR